VITTKGLKKISQDSSKTVLQHPDGHQLVIAHSKLKPEHAAKLAAMPFAEGGDVPTVNDLPSDFSSQLAKQLPKKQDSMSTPVDKFSNTGMQDSAVPQTEQQYAAQNMTNAPADPAQALTKSLTPADGQDPNALGNMPLGQGGKPADQPMLNGANLGGTGGIDQQIAGQNTLAKSEGILNATMQPDLQKQAEYSQSIANTAQEHSQALLGEMDKARQAYADKKIDPDQYMKSLSSGGKVETAIGLILGGIGGGILHQENPALKFLNSQIDRDIDSQKVNMDHDKNLFGMLKDQLGTEQAANMGTRAFMLDAIIDKTKAEAAKRGGVDAQARANIATGPLQMQKDQLVQRLGQISAARSILGSDAQPGMHFAATKALMSASGAPEAEQTKALAEMGEITGLNSMQKNMEDSFKKTAGMVGGGTFHPGDAAALKETYAGQLQVMLEHRYNQDAANKMVQNLFKNLGDSNTTVADKQKVLQSIFDTARSKTGETLKAYQIPIPAPKHSGNAVQSLK